MKKLTNLIKNTDTKKLIGLSVATAVGIAYGVKAVTKKHKQELVDSGVKQKASEALNNTLAAGAKVVGGIREDLNVIVDAAKDKSCAAKCAHCSIKDTFKPCCKNGKSCKAEPEEVKEEETPKPVASEEVVEAQKEADALAEKLKNDVLKAEKRAASAEAKKKATTPRAAKSNAKPVSVKEDAEKELGVGLIELDDLSDLGAETKDKPEDK
jgi:hypothetical protein